MTELKKLHELEIAPTLDLWLYNAGSEHSHMLTSMPEPFRSLAYDAVTAAWQAGYQAGFEEGAYQQG